MSSETISATDAARRLGVSSQAIRDWARSRKLRGTQNARGVWAIDADSVDELLAKRGSGSASARSRHDAGDERLDRLSAAVHELASRADASARLLEAVERERDRYRSESAAAREAGLRLNSAAQELDGAVRQLLDVMQLQREALSQLLAPGSPQDLLR